MATTSIKKQTITIEFPNPIESISSSARTLAERFSTFFSEVITDVAQSSFSQGKTSRVSKLPKISLPKFNFSKKSALRVVIPLVIVIALIVVLFKAVQKNPNSTVAGVATNTSKAEKSMTINREFKFPLRDGKGKQVGEFSYTIESAELRHNIIVKGQGATAVPGRVFLILNLKIVNSLKQGLQINTRDYVRFMRNSSDELLAADIHNDPVEAQAISTKNTRIGLAINESDRDLKVQVGEIDGSKEIISISF